VEEVIAVGVLAVFVLLYLVYYKHVVVSPTRFYYKEGSWQQQLIQECPSLPHFYPSVLLINNHLQTVGVKLLRAAPKISYRREYVKLSDDGQVAIDWDPEGLLFSEEAPTVIVMHGLVGSSTSKYIRNLVHAMRTRGFRPVVFNARGCGTSELSSPLIFNAGKTDDIRQVIKCIARRYPKSPLIAAAYSMGANILTKYLGEEKENCLLLGAVMVSNPFDLQDVANNSKKSLSSQFYGKILTRDLKKYFTRHDNVLRRHIDAGAVERSRNIMELDQNVTLKMFKYPTLQDYYKDCSCVSVMPQISIPVLFLNSLDDPIVPSACIAHHMADHNPNLLFAITERGGHTAYLKNWKWWKTAWSDDVIAEFLTAVLNSQAVLPAPSSPSLVEDRPLLAN